MRALSFRMTAVSAVPSSAAKSDKMQANQQQLTAIEALDGPLLIIAGPGAGKTFTLVERTINLISTRDVDPSRIWALSVRNISIKKDTAGKV